MQEHLSDETVDRYRRRTLSTDDLFAVDSHLSACEVCRLKALPLGNAFHAIASSLRIAGSAETHASYEQMEALVDGTADEVEREIITGHVQDCMLCKADVNDLQAFKLEIETVGRAPVTNRPSLRKRFTGFRVPGYRWIPLTGAAALAILLFVISVMVVRRQQNQQVTQTVPVFQPTSEESPSGIASPIAEQREEVALEINDDNRRITLDKQGNLVGLESLPPSAQRTIRAALTEGRVANATGNVALTGKPGTMLGSADDGVPFQLLHPVGKVIRQDRPTLRWRPLARATTYKVSVLDINYKVVAISPSLTVTEWKPTRPLPRGGTYSWQVTAQKDGQEITSPSAPAPEAKFKVLDGAKLTEIQRAEAAYPNSHLTRGVLYTEAGLFEEAEREFSALVKSNPQSSAARKLLQQVRTLRRSK